MFNLGPFELVAIFVVALLVFGPDKLPEMGRQIGKAVREFRKFQESMQGQVRDVLEPISGPIMGNGNVIGPKATNITGEIPTEVPAGQVNVPKSATIQNPDAPEGEEAAPPGTFGHYAPVESPTASESTGGETAAPPAADPAPSGEASAPDSPSDPETR
jgi:TatA/E family protein of Tat protein translocase